MREGWEYKKFTDVCDIQYGYAFDSKCFTDDVNAMPLIRIRDVVRGYSETFYNGDIPNGYIINEGDYLVGMDGEFNIGRWGKRAGLLNQRVCKIASSSKQLDNQYMYYFMKVCLKSIEDETPFVTVKHLSAKRINKIQIPIPPLSIQQSIVSELDEINNLLSLKRKELETYDKLAQSIFYEMFGDPVENEMGWEVKKLGEVGEIITGSTPSTNDESNWDGNVNWVTPAELDIQLYYGETKRKITTKAASSLRLMPIGTVLLSTRAPIGKLAITNVAMCCNQGFKNIICGIFLNNVFLYYYLMLTMDSIKAMGRGATFKEVSKTAISNYRVLLPPLPLQQLFAQRIEAIEEQKVHVKAAIEKLETLLAARMQYWFD